MIGPFHVVFRDTDVIFASACFSVKTHSELQSDCFVEWMPGAHSLFVYFFDSVFVTVIFSRVIAVSKFAQMS